MPQQTTPLVSIFTVKINVRQLMYEKTIRDKRHGNPITQEEVARTVGIANGTMSSWVRGTVDRLDKDTIAKFCQYFECRIDQLLELEEAPNPFGEP